MLRFHLRLLIAAALLLVPDIIPLKTIIKFKVFPVLMAVMRQCGTIYFELPLMHSFLQITLKSRQINFPLCSKNIHIVMES